MKALLFAIALTIPLASHAFADSKKEALDVVERWAKAFSDSDVDGIVKLHSPDALFLGTQSKTVVTKTAEIRSYFENALLNNRPRGAKLVQHEVLAVSDNMVVVTGLDAVSGVRDGTPFTNSGRVTFVVAKRGADWTIVHFHRSPAPR